MANFVIDAETGEVVGRVVLAANHAFNLPEGLDYMYVPSHTLSDEASCEYYELPVVEVEDLGYVPYNY